MAARKAVDDCSDDVAEQVKLIKEKTAQGSVTPVDALKRYKLALKNMIEKGDSKLDIFHTANGELVEKLNIIIMTAAEKPDLVSKATSLRDKIVGEALQYRNRFIKLMAEHEALLDGVLEQDLELLVLHWHLFLPELGRNMTFSGRTTSTLIALKKNSRNLLLMAKPGLLRLSRRQNPGKRASCTRR